MFGVLIPYSPEVPVLQSLAANKLQARCRSSSVHGKYICEPTTVHHSDPGSVQLTNSTNSTSNNERSINTRANKDGDNQTKAQLPSVVVWNVGLFYDGIAIFSNGCSWVEFVDCDSDWSWGFKSSSSSRWWEEACASTWRYAGCGATYGVVCVCVFLSTEYYTLSTEYYTQWIGY